MSDNTSIVPNDVLDEMKTYYKERASEYDEWFYRCGRFDRSPESNRQWFAEVQDVVTTLNTFKLDGDILELAPGTGIWTEMLLQTAQTITAVDASIEMIEINRNRVKTDRVTYEQADLFIWQPERIFDAVFFGFWISHIPEDRLDDFLQMLAKAVRPGGKFFFVDGRREPTSTAVNHTLPEEGQQTMTRKLNDGRAFTIVKNYYIPTALAERFDQAGFDTTVSETPSYFLYGYGTRR